MKKTLKKKLIIIASLIISIVCVLFLYIEYKKPLPFSCPHCYECTYRKVKEINNNYSLYAKGCSPSDFVCKSYYIINSTKDKIKIDANTETEYDIEFVYKMKAIYDISVDEIIECYLDNDCELNNDNSGGCQLFNE